MNTSHQNIIENINGGILFKFSITKRKVIKLSILIAHPPADKTNIVTLIIRSIEHVELSSLQINKLIKSSFIKFSDIYELNIGFDDGSIKILSNCIDMYYE